MEMCSAQLGGLNASTSALGSNPWPITLRCRLSCIGRLRSSFALALPAPLIKVLAPPPPNMTPARLGSPMRFIPLNRWTGSCLVLVGIGVCTVVLKVLAGRLGCGVGWRGAGGIVVLELDA